MCAAKGGRPEGERPTVRRTDNHVARTKGGLATARPKQVDKGGNRTHDGRPGDPDAKAQAQTRVNPGGGSHDSVVKAPRSNAGLDAPSLCEVGEGSIRDRKSERKSRGIPASGGWACEEGLPREGGRSHEGPGGEAPSESPQPGDRVEIRARPETRPDAREKSERRIVARKPRNGGGAKGPHLGAAWKGETGRPSRREA